MILSRNLKNVYSDIRGDIYMHALELEKEGKRVLKLNTGNPAAFGFKMPESINDLNKIILGLSNSKFDDSVFEFIKSKQVKLTFENDVNWSLDGEHHKSGKEVVIENLKRAVTIVK